MNDNVRALPAPTPRELLALIRDLQDRVLILEAALLPDRPEPGRPAASSMGEPCDWNLA